MRFVSIVAAVAALSAMLVMALPEAATAGGFRDRGWGEARVVTHRIYRPRYVHVYRHKREYRDPYAYHYVPRRYYPHYNSNYWKPPHHIRRRQYYRQPPYYKAWGYPTHRRYYRERRRFRRW